MPACIYCSSSEMTRDGHNQRGRAVYACRACGRHATSESASLVAGHRFPRDIILLAVRYYLQLGAAAERIAGILADRRHRCERPDHPALGPEVRASSVRGDPPVQDTSEYDVAAGRDVREDPGQVALPVSRRRREWPGARLLVVADA